MKQFVERFTRKAFEPRDANRQLEVEVLPPLPKELLEEESRARREFLSHLNLTTGLEAMLLQHVSQDPPVGPLSAALKLSFSPSGAPS